MTLPALLTFVGSGLSSAGLFGVRAFLPAFIAAASLRLAQTGHLPLSALEDLKGTAPTWFTSDAALIVLGILATLEIAGRKITEIRAAMDEAAPWIKSAAAAVTFLAAHQVLDLSPESVETIKHIGEHALGHAHLPQQASVLSLAIVPALLAAGATYVLAQGLRSVRDMLHLDAGHGHAFSWVGDLWVVFGALLLILFPLLGILVGLGVAGFALWFKRRIERRERQGMAACGTCHAAQVRPSALMCPGCKAPQPHPRETGWFGRPTEEETADRAGLPLRLALHGRCPDCASPLAAGATPRCDACATAPFDDTAFRTRYANAVSARLWWILPLCALAGLIPVAGVIVSVALARLCLVQPFSLRVGFQRRFVTRWGVRLVIFLLAVLQLIPVAGAVPAVAIALLSHSVWRASFLASGRPRLPSCTTYSSSPITCAGG